MISASEVGDYVYCRRCWYVRVRGLLPRTVTQKMRYGAAQHTHLAGELERSEWAWRLLIVVIALAVIVCLILLLILGVIGR